jgi:hypothetical protein
MVGEYFVDCLGGGTFDFFVSVHERETEFERQAFADGRLTAAHQPDKHDGALSDAFPCEVNRFRFSHRVSTPLISANRSALGSKPRSGTVISAPSCHEPKLFANWNRSRAIRGAGASRYFFQRKGVSFKCRTES